MYPLENTRVSKCEVAVVNNGNEHFSVLILVLARSHL